MNILEKIIAQKVLEVSPLSRTLKNASTTKSRRNFKKAITKVGKHPKLIAEIKKASPSRGSIFPGADILEIAEIYEKNGAAAISVLTDMEFFNGSLASLHSVAREGTIPVLRKDFIIDELQILEARLSEADAVLLMVTVLKDPDRVRALREYAASLSMDCLVETHSAEEIKVALDAGATIIGVNARNFSDLSVDLEHFETLLPLIPDDCIKVAESGLRQLSDVQKVAPLCDAILVGTHFMGVQDYTQIATLTKEFSQI